MYEMVRQMWQLGRITAEQIARLVTLGRITAEQGEAIVGTENANGEGE